VSAEVTFCNISSERLMGRAAPVGIPIASNIARHHGVAAYTSPTPFY
jgi:hypothetical protein